MRSALITVGALVVIGLAAFGVVSAQKAPPPSAEAAKPVVAANPIRRPATPVQDIAQAQAAELPQAAAVPAASPVPPPAAPVRVAQDTTAPAPQTQNAPAAKPATASSNTAAAAPSNGIPPCDKPGGMGLSRIVEIDTTGGPGFGFEHFKQYDFLRDKEVVLTFDDGPWPENTPAVLRALADNCIKATFFEIGEHATWHPEITKEVVAAGMTLGSHTWSHKDLARNPYAKDIELAKAEIEMGFSAVHNAAGVPIAPFFRFPALQHPPDLLAYMSERNIGVFSADFDSRDFKMRKPEEVIKSVMTKLEKNGKGIILMHDFRRATAEAMPELLRQMKAGGYKVVHLVPHQMVTTLPKYDEMVTQKDKLSANNTRPEGSVLHTIGEYVGSPAPASPVHE
ncbi:MAG: polysaccharide deacetylase family protein [Xanthobacteraceae bacterium]|jgi:peptidoglycan/xylan/chitin deacetylase (PgdA/CDA1 family)